jgi:uncharacterized protein (TIGR02145 family)
MQKLVLLIMSVFLSMAVYAQAPEKIDFQAVIRNSHNQLVSNQPIGMRVSILQDSVSGTAVYVETHQPTTNTNGLVSIAIGAGTVVSGTFADIDWSDGPFYVKTEADPTGETSYTITGTSQLLSVPYALYAKTAQTLATGLSVSPNGDTLYLGLSSWVIVPGISAANGSPATGSELCGSGSTEIVDVTSWTGMVWMDRNLGASQAATSSTDSASYGSLYQWGRGSDGHQCRNSAVVTTLSSSDQPGHGDFISGSDWRNPTNDNLWQGVNGVNNPCPSGYRLPTAAEFDIEVGTWETTDIFGANEAPLKLPAAGYRQGEDFIWGSISILSGSIYNVGTYGWYWSSTIDDSGNPVQLYFAEDDAYTTAGGRTDGGSVRCIKEPE